MVTAVDVEADPRALSALSESYGVPGVDLLQVRFPVTNLELIPIEIARRNRVLPFAVQDDTICLAMADPSERRVIEELEFVTGRRVFPYAALSDQVLQTVERAYAARDRGESHFVGPRVATTTSSAGTEDVQRAMPGRPLSNGTAPGIFKPTSPRPISLDQDLDAPDTRRTLLSTPPGPGAERSSRSTAGSSASRTILVVDDEEDIRRLLRRILEDRGYHVLEADRGSVALQMVKQSMPDAIVLDANLPELHGFDICRRIKSSARYGHIPILMISAVYRGWRFAEDLKSAYGVTAYIEKPFRISDVLAAVESMLAGAARADARDPDTLSSEADRALQTGMEAYRAGDVELAIQHVERALSLDPLSYKLHYHLALLVGRRGDIFRAIQELETAIDLNPRSFSALKNLAVLYQKAGFKNKAIEMWERAIGHSPDDETRGQLKEHLMSLL